MHKNHSPIILLLCSLILISCKCEIAILNYANCKITYTFDKGSNIYTYSSCIQQKNENDVGSSPDIKAYTYSTSNICSSKCCGGSNLDSYDGLQLCIANDQEKMNQQQNKIQVLILTLAPALLFTALGICLIVELFSKIFIKNNADKQTQNVKQYGDQTNCKLNQFDNSWMIPKTNNNAIKKQICSICYGRFPDSSTNCKHYFHRSCMVKFGMIMSKTCPQCFSSNINPIMLHCLNCFKNQLEVTIEDNNYAEKFQKANKMCSHCSKSRFYKPDAIAQSK